MFDTYEPDAKLIRQKVAEAIDAAEGDRTQKAAGRPTTDGSQEARQGPEDPGARRVTGGSVGSLSEGYAANESQDLDSAC